MAKKVKPPTPSKAKPVPTPPPAVSSEKPSKIPAHALLARMSYGPDGTAYKIYEDGSMVRA